MAKKKTKVVDTCCAPASVGDYKPRLYLSLHDKQVDQIKGLKIGEEVELVVKGKVVALSQRESKTHEGKDRKSGDIDLEGYTVEVMGEDDNEFTKMADED